MTVELPTELTLRCVAETRKGMLTALQSRETLEIDVTKVAEVDVAGLQLLCSPHRGAKAGFARQMGCAPGGLWLEQSRE